MSERTDQIIEHHLNQHPLTRRAYDNDAVTHMQVEWARQFLDVMESVLRREHVEYDVAERVLNEAMRISLGDWQQEKLRRERELLLTTFDPSASDVTINQPFTELAEGSPVRDDLFPEERPVSSEETST